MLSGTVKWFDAAKCFGFVIPNNGGPDIYVHLKVLQKAGLETLEPGTTVEYSVANRGGKQFVEGISVVAAPVPAPVTKTQWLPTVKAKRAALDEEEEFEREWGLRRA